MATQSNKAQPAVAAAGLSYTPVNLSAVTLDDGSPGSVFNAGSSSLGTSSSIVLDSGDPGFPDATLNPFRFHWEIASTLDLAAYAGIHLRFKCTAAVHSSQTYTAWMAVHATSSLGAEFGWWGGANLNTGVARAAKIGAALSSSASGSTFTSGGTFGLLISCLVPGVALAPSVALGAFLAFDLFKTALGDVHYYVFASHAPTVVDSSAWSELAGVVRGFSDAGFPDQLIRVGTRVSWPAALIFTVVACLALRRRSL